MAIITDGVRIHALDHALSVVLSMRLPVDNTGYAAAKYITISELAQAIGANTAGYVYPTATPGILNYDITNEIFTGEPYGAKKPAPEYPYFYTGLTDPTYMGRLNLDGDLHVSKLTADSIQVNAIEGTAVSWLGLDENGNLVASGLPVDSFLGLSDVIADTYVAKANYVPMVNDGETGLDLYQTVTAIFTLLADVPGSYAGMGGRVVTVRVDEQGLDFTSLSTEETGVNLPQVVGPLSNASGIPGSLVADDDYIYYCVANNRWKRFSLQNY